MKTDSFDDLLDRVLDGLADESECQSLGDLLRTDASVRIKYVEACQLRQVVADLVVEGEELPKQAVPAGSQRPQGWKSALGLLSALAAMLVIAVIWSNSGEPSVPSTSASAPGGSAKPSQLPAIAKVERSIDCVWSDASLSLGTDDKISAGQIIAIDRGLMSLAFDNGVKVLLEGPAEFSIIDSLHGVLELGGVVVRVPKGFSGYVVDTPSARVTDLGTEFSVRVGDAGNTSLKVIEGEVTVSERKRNGELKKGEPKLLQKDDIWSSLSNLRVPKGAPSVEDFPSVSQLKDPIPVRIPELPVKDDRLLWLRADLATKLGGMGHVIVWGDLSSEVAEERHSAWQVEPKRRPDWIADGIAGKPSVRFDGTNDFLTTEPFENGNQQTIVVVARLNKLKGKGGDVMPAQQILNYNGPPHLVLEYRWSVPALRARAFGGYESQQQHSGQNRARDIQAGETLAIVYLYDHQADHAALYLNGMLQSESRASIPISNSRPKVIGLHRRRWSGGLVGDVSEVIIYDRALAPEEIVSTFAYLDERYGPLPTEAPVAE